MNCLTTKEILERQPEVAKLCDQAMRSFLGMDFPTAERSLAEADRAVTGKGADIRSCVALVRAQLRDNQGRSAESRTELQGLLKELGKAGTLGVVMRVQIGHSECLLGDLTSARTTLQQAYDDAAQTRDRLLAGQAALRQAMHRFRLRVWAESMKFANESLEIAREDKDPLLEIYARMLVAKNVTHSDDPDKGRVQFEELLKETDALGYRLLSAKLLAEIGCCFCEKKQLDDSQTAYERAEALLDGSGCSPARHVVLANLGNIQLLQKNYSKALDLYKQAAEMADAVGDDFAVARWDKNVAVAYKESGDVPSAKTYANKAAQRFRKAGDEESAQRCDHLCEKRLHAKDDASAADVN